MPMNVSLLDDIEQNANGYLNLENAVKNLNKPLLIAHGDQDLAVPIAEAEQIYYWSDKSKLSYSNFSVQDIHLILYIRLPVRQKSSKNF